MLAEEKEYKLILDMPGVGKDEVSVEPGPIPGTVLVRVEPKDGSSTSAASKGTPVRVERAASRPGGLRMERIIPVAPDADAGQAKTALKDGVLTVSLPKHEPAKPTTGKRAGSS